MTGHLQREKSAKIAPKQDGLQRMVDRETKRAEGKGVGYDRWASLLNLKQDGGYPQLSHGERIA